MKQTVRLSYDEWMEVADLIDQCIQVAYIDESYSDCVRDKAIAMMMRMRNEAVDNGLRKKANGVISKKKIINSKIS